MRKRIYWLLPDLGSARRTMNELLLARISERHIHFMASEEADLSGLHAANVLQTTDLVSAAQTGLVLGAGVGAAGGVAMGFELAGVAEPAGIVIGMAALGAMLGAWVASMAGSAAPSRRLRRFEIAMAQGQYLLMVDVPRTRVGEIEALLEETHPEAHFEGLEPQVPAFP